MYLKALLKTKKKMLLRGTWRPLLLVSQSILFLLHCAISAIPTVLASDDVDVGGGRTNDIQLRFQDLGPCSLGSFEISQLGVDDFVEPCILTDINPDGNEEKGQNENNFISGYTTLTLVQVTPSQWPIHRDGAVIAVEAINNDNNGRGGSVGYDGKTYVKFRYVCVVAGNSANLSPEVYRRNHEQLLDSMLETIKPQYIVGTSSFVSPYDKAAALKHKTMLMAQVGPPGFYTNKSDPPSNEYVFGIHVNSDTYPLPALRQLTFRVTSRDGGAAAQPVRILSRDRSEFFQSTCRSVYNEAIVAGFTDTSIVEYDPTEMNGEGLENENNKDFLSALAAEACPKFEGEGNSQPHPAIFLCTMTAFETETILETLKTNGCRPILLWSTPATWEWANNNPAVTYMQGGGQWHQSMKYSDEYYPSGQAVVDAAGEKFGYNPSYALLAVYTIPYVFLKHIQSYFRVVDNPGIKEAFSERYEELRRAMIVLFADTVYGPVTFDSNRRNAGRGAAGMQWLPSSLSSAAGDTEHKIGDDFLLACVSPLDQAEAAIVLPAPSSIDCPAGNFVNGSAVVHEQSICEGKCASCPIGTYTADRNEKLQCLKCPEGTYTEEEGASNCLRHNSNLVSQSIIAFGYVLLAINWVLSIGFASWTLWYRKDPVVKFGQIHFLLLICLGAFISGSAIIPLTIQADAFEDTSGATTACMVWPFLYTFGWILQYSSLGAKSFRLHLIAHAGHKRRRVTAWDTCKFVVVSLLLDLAVVTMWAVVDPFEWVRKATGVNVDEENSVVTFESVGGCSSQNIWYWLGPLIAIHLTLMILTNYLLFRNRDVSARYQEQKYVGLASMCACEILLVGVPILVAVDDSSEATFIAKSAIISLSDISILCFIFLPKIMFQRQGLPEGIPIVSTILKASNKSRKTHEFSTRTNQESFQGQ